MDDQLGSLRFRVVEALARRGAVEQDRDEPLPKDDLLMVTDRPVLEWYGEDSHYGQDRCTLYPAVRKGARCWMLQKVWYPARGYSASGTEQEVISFQDGVELFLERGVFKFPMPEKE